MAQAVEYSPGLASWRGLDGRWHHVSVTEAEITAATAGREDYLSGLSMEQRSFGNFHLQQVYEEAYCRETLDHCDVVCAIRDGRSPEGGRSQA